MSGQQTTSDSAIHSHNESQVNRPGSLFVLNVAQEKSGYAPANSLPAREPPESLAQHQG